MVDTQTSLATLAKIFLALKYSKLWKLSSNDGVKELERYYYNQVDLGTYVLFIIQDELQWRRLRQVFFNKFSKR